MVVNDLPCLLHTLPIQSLKGVGPKTLNKLKSLNLHTVFDLLFYLPSRYQNKSTLSPICELTLDNEVLIEGTLNQGFHSKTTTGKQKTSYTLQDSTGSINLHFFNLSSAQKKNLANNNSIRCFGTVKTWGHQLCLIHPEYTVLNPNNPLPLPNTFIPIYPTTQGLGQHTLYKLIQQALTLLKQYPFPELLPEAIQKQCLPYTLNSALSCCHCPNLNINTQDLLASKHVAKQRLIIEELLAYQLHAQLSHQQHQQQHAYALTLSSAQHSLFLSQLDFTLTDDQTKASNTLLHDINQTTPMNRLLQGDVGCGKTIVAALAIFAAMVNDKQAVLLAPTEILANQQAQSLKQLFKQHQRDHQVACLTSQLSNKTRQDLLNKIQSGDIKVIVGTHAIFQNTVNYCNLALVVIDEQHRFGVEQRLELLNKGKTKQYVPHYLIMTATPIPRTLTMSFYTHLNYTNIHTLPKNRHPITTVAISKTQINTVIKKIDSYCNSGQQVYWVCPFINEHEQLNTAAADTMFTKLKQALPHRSINLLHGQLSNEKKQTIMQQFKQGHTHILVATTMVEVGLDIANANLMIIDSCERLGLAQLHQLRGRVGRSTQPGFCILLYQSPLSLHAKQRLEILRQTNNGFEIAEKDWELRGTGSWLSTEQSGEQPFYFADLKRDGSLMELVNACSSNLINQSLPLAQAIIHRWLPRKSKYAHV